jgi:hypothetical protein
LFSLLLVWMQTVVGAQSTVRSAESTECICSNCGKACCCVTPSSPDSAPAPATPVRAGVQTELTMLASTSVAWTQPATEPQVPSLSASSPLTAMGVPLFTRHCALLI